MCFRTFLGSLWYGSSALKKRYSMRLGNWRPNVVVLTWVATCKGGVCTTGPYRAKGVSDHQPVRWYKQRHDTSSKPI